MKPVRKQQARRGRWRDRVLYAVLLYGACVDRGVVRVELKVELEDPRGAVYPPAPPTRLRRFLRRLYMVKPGSDVNQSPQTKEPQPPLHSTRDLRPPARITGRYWHASVCAVRLMVTLHEFMRSSPSGLAPLVRSESSSPHVRPRPAHLRSLRSLSDAPNTGFSPAFPGVAPPHSAPRASSGACCRLHLHHPLRHQRHLFAPIPSLARWKTRQCAPSTPLGSCAFATCWRPSPEFPSTASPCAHTATQQRTESRHTESRRRMGSLARARTLARRPIRQRAHSAARETAVGRAARRRLRAEPCGRGIWSAVAGSGRRGARACTRGTARRRGRRCRGRAEELV